MSIGEKINIFFEKYIVSIVICVFILGFSYFIYDKKIRAEYEYKGICYETKARLTKMELYQNAIYDYLNEEIKESNSHIKKYKECKLFECGIYVPFNQRSTIGNMLNYINGFTNSHKYFYKLNDIDFDKDYVISKNITSFYSRESPGSGRLFIFTKVVQGKELGYDSFDRREMFNNNSYYIGVHIIIIDEKGIALKETLDEKTVIFNRLSSCGKIQGVYFFY